MKKIGILLITMMVGLTTHSQTIDDLRRFFDYDPSQDLNYRVFNSIDTTEATMLNIQYAGGNGMQVTAYLIIPKNQLRRYPVVIFLHGLGQDKNAFLTEALELASRSIASLLIDAPPARLSSQKMNYQNYADPRKDQLVHRQTVLDVRRGIDLLGNHPKIDADRIAFVGMDYGSWTGAIVAGIDQRILTYVLIGCPTQPVMDLRNSNEPQMAKIRSSLTTEQVSQYEVTMEKLEPIHFLGYHRNSNILFQFSETDPSTPETMVTQIFQVTSEPKKKEVFKVPTAELINFTEAQHSRKKWLFDHL